MAYPVFNPYMNQMQNPYAGIMQMQPQQQFVQPQQFVQQQTGLNGKVVEGFDTFKTADIPMDGSVYYFPKADGTEIYTKRWLQNGTTEQSVYKIVQEQQEEKSNPLMDKLNVIEEQLVSLQESLNKQTRTTAKKES